MSVFYSINNCMSNQHAVWFKDQSKTFIVKCSQIHSPSILFRCSLKTQINFEVFGNRMKHSSECLIYLLKPLKILEENQSRRSPNFIAIKIKFPNLLHTMGNGPSYEQQTETILQPSELSSDIPNHCCNNFEMHSVLTGFQKACDGLRSICNPNSICWL